MPSITIYAPLAPSLHTRSNAILSLPESDPPSLNTYEVVTSLHVRAPTCYTCVVCLFWCVQSAGSCARDLRLFNVRCAYEDHWRQDLHDGLAWPGLRLRQSDDRRGHPRLGRRDARDEAGHGRGGGRDVEGFVLGQDPTRIEFLWQRMYRQGFWRPASPSSSAIRAIEQALWDITGKAYGQPVYKLLGGAARDYIPCYTHCGDPQRAVELMGIGWRAFKAGPARRVAVDQPVIDEREIIRETAANYEALRDGRRRRRRADVRLSRTLAAFRVAIRLGHALEPYDLSFFEEPVPPDNVLALRAVRDARLTMDLATGERAFTKWGYRELIENQLVDIDPAGCLSRRRDQGDPEDRGDGRDVQHPGCSTQSERPGRDRRERPRFGLRLQLQHPGVRAVAHS